jgi:hypothetical protein
MIDAVCSKYLRFKFFVMKNQPILGRKGELDLPMSRTVWWRTRGCGWSFWDARGITLVSFLIRVHIWVMWQRAWRSSWGFASSSNSTTSTTRIVYRSSSTGTGDVTLMLVTTCPRRTLCPEFCLVRGDFPFHLFHLKYSSNHEYLWCCELRTEWFMSLCLAFIVRHQLLDGRFSSIISKKASFLIVAYLVHCQCQSVISQHSVQLLNG